MPGAAALFDGVDLLISEGTYGDSADAAKAERNKHMTFAEAATLAAIERKESRGGHTRDDYPNTDARFAKVNVVLRMKNGAFTLSQEPLPEMPDELKALLEETK